LVAGDVAVGTHLLNQLEKLGQGGKGRVTVVALCSAHVVVAAGTVKSWIQEVALWMVGGGGGWLLLGEGLFW
jgi:hypothetical protein